MNEYKMEENVVYTAKVRNTEEYMPILVYRDGKKIKEYFTRQTLCTIIRRKVDIAERLNDEYRLVFYKEEYKDENGQTHYRLLQANKGVINTYEEQAKKGKNFFIRNVLGIEPKTENRLYIGFLGDGKEKIKILFYKDNGEIKEYKTDILIPEELIKDRLIAPKGSIREYEGFKKEKLEEIIGSLQRTSLLHRLRKIKIKLLLKTNNIYVGTLRTINVEQSIERFKCPIDSTEKRYISIPGSSCRMKDNLPLFEITNPEEVILVYKTLFGSRELLTGASITVMEKLNYTDPDTDVVPLIGKSGSSFIESEELTRATNEVINKYIECPPENMRERLVEIFRRGKQAYDDAMSRFKNQYQQPRLVVHRSKSKKMGEYNEQN